VIAPVDEEWRHVSGNMVGGRLNVERFVASLHGGRAEIAHERLAYLVFELRIGVTTIYQTDTFVGNAFGVVGENGIFTYNSDINIALPADVRVVSIGAVYEYPD
jgi:hypothetical protein